MVVFTIVGKSAFFTSGHEGIPSSKGSEWLVLQSATRQILVTQCKQTNKQTLSDEAVQSPRDGKG